MCTTCTQRTPLDIIVLMFFVLVLGVCLRLAINGDQEAERSEEDAYEGVRA